MFKKLKMLALSAATALTIMAPLAFAGVASAIDTTYLCGGANLTTSTASDCGQTTTSTFSNTLTTIVNVLSLVIGIVAVIMIIIAGFNYITSSGDDSKVKSAKNTILYAVIGLVIVAFAQVIVKFVIAKAQPQ